MSDKRSFSARLREVEDDCMRRLDFVDQQLDRVSREGPWDRRLTVSDADIMPVGRVTSVFAAVERVPTSWRWLVPAAAGAIAAGLVILLVRACS